jgi:Kdo2-lipid IVA lauroyltransferase/acyltransferase
LISLVKLLLWLLSLLPGPAPYAIARRLARLWAWLSPDKRRVARINLRRCYPHLGEAEREKLVHDSFIHYICTVLETGRNWFWDTDRLQALCDGIVNEELLLRELHSGKGLVVLAPHFGAWEYLGMYLQRFPDIAILYKPPGHPGLEKALLAKRERGGANMLAANPAGLRKLYAHVRAGKGAGVLPDQQPSQGQGRFAPFFGIPALTAVLSPRLIKATGCRVLMGVCERLPQGRYRVHMLPADEAVYSEDLDEALAGVNRGVERCIDIDIAQYLWSYRRFRAQPEGEPPFYAE